MFNKLKLYVFIFNKLTKITSNGLHKHSVHQTILWTCEVCIDMKNRSLFVFIVSFVCIPIQYTLLHSITWSWAWSWTFWNVSRHEWAGPLDLQLGGIWRTHARYLLYHSNLIAHFCGVQQGLKLNATKQSLAKLCNFWKSLRPLHFFILEIFLHILVTKINSYCSAKDGLIVIPYAGLLHGSVQKVRLPGEFQDNFDAISVLPFCKISQQKISWNINSYHC